MDAVGLKPAARDDMPLIWRMQLEAFSGLLEQYRDYDTSPGVHHRALDTIAQEAGNLHLYEKMGYDKTEQIQQIHERMDIVFYEKD